MAAAFASLGRWQLQRAEVNRALETQFQEALDLPPIEHPVADADVDALRYRRMTLRGQFLPEAQILLDNMTSRGRVGYQVLTPFLSGGSQRLVLVNRGWVPASPDRQQLPDITLGQEPTIVRGRIDHLPRAALQLDAPPPAGHQPVTVMSYPDFDAVAAALGQELYRFQLLLDPAAAFGFERDWQPRNDLAERNIAYAVQWFGLAVLALVIAIGMAVRHGRRPRL